MVENLLSACKDVFGLGSILYKSLWAWWFIQVFMPNYHLQVFRPSSSFWGFSTLTWEGLPCSGYKQSLLEICEVNFEAYCHTELCLESRSGLALITKNEARLWTDGRYFLQETHQLSDQRQIMRTEEDPAVYNWMADVSH